MKKVIDLRNPSEKVSSNLELINSNYDSMNYLRSVDEYYLVNMVLYFLGNLSELAVLILYFKPIVKKYFTMKYSEMGLCIHGNVVSECKVEGASL